MSPPPRVLLCVDDRPDLLRLRETLLGKLGYVVIDANSAAAATAKLENCAIDAVLLEYKSEGRGSRSLPDQTTVLQPTNNPSVAYSEMPERVLWLVDEYVMKSEPIEGLVQVIERAIRAKKEDYKPCRGRVVAFKKTSSGGSKSA